MNESTELERVWGSSSSSCRAAPPILELDIIQVRVAWWVETWISHVKQNKESLSIISSLFVSFFLSPSSLKVPLPDSTLLLPTLHWMLLYLHRKSPGRVHRWSAVPYHYYQLTIRVRAMSDRIWNAFVPSFLASSHPFSQKWLFCHQTIKNRKRARNEWLMCRRIRWFTMQPRICKWEGGHKDWD